VSAFTNTKMHEREVMRDLADTLAEMEDSVLRDAEDLRIQLDTQEEWDLLVRYGQRGGRHPLAQALTSDVRSRISLSSRGLSNNEITPRIRRIGHAPRGTPRAITSSRTIAGSRSRSPYSSRSCVIR
jgi:hypothetical protein